MCRVLLGAVVAVALSGAAAAQDFDDRPWTRTELPTGDMVWIASEDLGNSRVHVLKPGAGRVRYTITEYDFRCDGGVTETVWDFGLHGEALAERPPRPEREVRPGTAVGALYDIACEGAPALTDIEVGSAREALEYGAMAEERGWNPERRRWDSGPGGPEREPREEREPPAPYDE